MRLSSWPAVVPLLLLSASAPSAPPRFLMSFPAARSAQALDGRLLLILSVDSTSEPRFQVSDAANTAQIFGIDVDAWTLTQRYGSAQVFGGGLRVTTSLDLVLQRLAEEAVNAHLPSPEDYTEASLVAIDPATGRSTSRWWAAGSSTSRR